MVDTAEPDRGRANERLLAHLAALEALDPARPSATERLHQALGPELSRKLLFALAPNAERPPCDAAA
jgi:hypothetical protein